MWIKDIAVSSGIVQDDLLQTFLLEYFPNKVVQKFRSDVLKHPLGAHVIATQATNAVLDGVGITYVHRVSSMQSVSPASVVRAALSAHLLLNAGGIIADLAKLDTLADNATFLEMRRELGTALRATATWLVGYHHQAATLTAMVSSYIGPFKRLLAVGSELLEGEDAAEYTRRYGRALAHGINEHTARTVALFPWMVQTLEVLWSTMASGNDVKPVARVFTGVIEGLKVSTFLRSDTLPQPKNNWEAEILATSSEDIRRSLSQLTVSLVRQGIVDSEKAREKVRTCVGIEQLRATLDEIRGGVKEVSVLAVVARKLRLLSV